MKLTKKLSKKQFGISIFLILLTGLIFLFGLNYILNVQYTSPKSRFSQGPVTLEPKSLRIDVDEPSEDSLFFSPQLTVSGKTGPKLSVLISTQDFDAVVKSDKDGRFQTEIELEEGPSKITVTSFDANGDLRSQERNVYYSKEKI